MQRTVILAPAAQDDRQHLRSWFRQPGAGQAAQHRLAALEAAIANLANFPMMNRAGPVANTRLLISQNHRILYAILPGADRSPEAGDVLILRIYGPGQHFE